MKNLAGLVFLCLIPFIQLAAQSKWAIKAGWNINNTKDYISPDHAPPLVFTSSADGFHIGMVHTKSWSESLGLQVEMLYSLKGARAMFMRARDQQFHYLSFPAMVSWNPGKFQLKGGLELSYLITQKTTGWIKIIDPDRKLDIGGILGVGMDISQRWMIEARYVHGFTPLVDYSVSDQATAPEATYQWYNRVAQLSLSFYL